MSVLLDLISCRIPKAIEDHAHALHCCLRCSELSSVVKDKALLWICFQQSILVNYRFWRVREGSAYQQQEPTLGDHATMWHAAVCYIHTDAQ